VHEKATTANTFEQGTASGPFFKPSLEPFFSDIDAVHFEIASAALVKK
jgi:hypothetical protein